MRILHLAYEDPSQPGSGGGSVRTLEINKRLAERHEITALVAAYPGSSRRTEYGINWIPLGTRTGTKLDRLSYFSLLGPAIRRHPHDLVVEDFSAPFSVGFAPLFTSKPVVASVQWLFADKMREKYHLPFDLVEHYGLKLYSDFITVSDWLGQKVLKQRPLANVETIYNGIEPLAFTLENQKPAHFLFVGRLDIEQKGVDLLLESYAIARAEATAPFPPLAIVGDGPDRGLLEQKVLDLNLGEAVYFHGRINGREKYEMMAKSFAVVMPSRHETFGLVAVETLAVGVPLITYEVGPLAEVVGDTDTFLIPPFDTRAFARAMLKTVDLAENPASLSAGRRDFARQYDWDTIAARQEAHYMKSVRGTEPYLRVLAGGKNRI